DRLGHRLSLRGPGRVTAAGSPSHPDAPARAGRGGSLFWTFAGVFLLVLAIATALQIVVSVGVIRPLSIQSDRDRAEAALGRIATALLALPDLDDGREIMRTLHEHPIAGTDAITVFMPVGGRMVPER